MSIRDWRKKIKAVLESLPFGIGGILLMSILRVWTVFIYRREAHRIHSAIENGAKKAIIVYDTSCSALAYGEYLKLILLARYFQATGIPVIFYNVNDGLRKDWKDLLSGQEKDLLLDDLAKIARTLLRRGSAEIITVSWEDFIRKSLKSELDNAVIPFFNLIQNRRGIYAPCFNLLNYLLSCVESEFLDKVLFSNTEMQSCVKFKLPDFPYITWHVRYNKKWSSDRNLSDEEFLKTFFFLSLRYKHYRIMAVSDFSGCNYFKELSQKYNFNLLFSKDYTDSFLGDSALILNSKYYFQFRGGGIGIVPMYSRMSYTIVSELANETPWNKRKLMPWQTKSQVFITKNNVNFSSLTFPNSAESLNA